jgi:ABC-type nitrate/sulfonate/bicarbonate transport system substrate-binding protein
VKKRQKKKQAYKNYIQAIFEGYEKMLENPDIKELVFTYLKEETRLTRDSQQQIHFLTRDLID